MAETVKKTRGNKNLPAGPGRPKGVPNKTTAALKDAILTAAALSGRDKKGKEGLVGYLRRVADNDVKAFSGLLGKVLPMTVQGPGENGEHVFQKIVIEVVQPQR